MRFQYNICSRFHKNVKGFYSGLTGREKPVLKIVFDNLITNDESKGEYDTIAFFNTTKKYLVLTGENDNIFWEQVKIGEVRNSKAISVEFHIKKKIYFELDPDDNFRVLSLDGGGIKGMLTLSLLKSIVNALVEKGEYKSQREFLDEIDLFAGTSVGSIIAMSFAVGYDIDETERLLERLVRDLFGKQPLWRRVVGLSLFSKYHYDAMGDWVKELFTVTANIAHLYPEKEIGEIIYLSDLRQFALCTAVHLDNEATIKKYRRSNFVLMHNLPHLDTTIKTANSHHYLKELPCRDAVFRSVSAPLYMPAFQGFIDGGVVANNPTLSTVVTCLDCRFLPCFENLSKIRVLNVGTGKAASFMRHRAKEDASYVEYLGKSFWWKLKNFKKNIYFTDYGLADYGNKIVYIAMDNVADNDHHNSHMLLGRPQYGSINIHLDRPIELDDVDQIPSLVAIGKDYHKN